MDLLLSQAVSVEPSPGTGGGALWLGRYSERGGPCDCAEHTSENNHKSSIRFESGRARNADWVVVCKARDIPTACGDTKRMDREDWPEATPIEQTRSPRRGHPWSLTIQCLHSCEWYRYVSLQYMHRPNLLTKLFVCVRARLPLPPLLCLTLQHRRHLQWRQRPSQRQYLRLQ